MNSPVTVSPIPLDKIDQDVSNHRLISDPASDQQLVDSISANGVQQPIKVSSKAGGRFTLVFGFRRMAAAKRAGLTSIPAIVEHDLDINTIRALQAIENLERRALHPMEEAQFCQDLAETIVRRPDSADDDDGLAEALAQRIGRSRKWVELRLAMARLSPRVKQAFMDGDIHLQHAQLIARLVSHEAQEEVLGYVRAQESSWLKGRERIESKRPPSTIAETRAQVEKMLRDLATVPWKLEARFAGLPDCASCPHNSANRLDLFDGDQPKKPQCLDASCYSQKAKAASRAVVKATNTAIKEADKVTPSVAQRAIVGREVEFVRTPAVVEAARRRQKPSAASAAERRGQSSWELRHKAERAWRKAWREWYDHIGRELEPRMFADEPVVLAMLMLINRSGLIHWISDDSDEQAEGRRRDFAEAIRILARSGSRPADDLEDLCEILKPYLAADEDEDEDEQTPALSKLMGYAYPGESDDAIKIVAEAYGLDAPPPPDLETISAQIPGEGKAA
ncbi:MAG: ParB/RepB/Spo0J family partition protein [Wenzhouxiangella sp.]